MSSTPTYRRARTAILAALAALSLAWAPVPAALAEDVVPSVVTGRLVDLDGPVADAYLELDSEDPDAYTWSEADGTFTIETLDVGPATVYIDSEDHRLTTRAVNLAGTVDLGSITLTQIPRLVVTVTTTTGDPVPNAGLVVTFGHTPRWVSTDEDGVYRSGELTVGDRVHVGLSGDTWAYDVDAGSVTVTADRPRTQVSVNAHRAASVVMEVQTADGTPVELPNLFAERIDGGPTPSTTFTTGPGTAVVRRLLPGTYTLWTSADLFDTALGTVTVAEGENVNLGVKKVRFYTATDKHRPVIGSPELVGGSRSYDTERLGFLAATLTDFDEKSAREIKVDLLDARGTVVRAAHVEDGRIYALVDNTPGTYSGYRFKLRADGHHHEAVSPVSRTFTISKRPSRLTGLRLSSAKTRWGVRPTIYATYTGALSGTLQLLADGKVVTSLLAGTGSTSSTGTQKIDFLVPTLAVGKHKLTIRYAGTAYDAPATTTSATITVTKAVSKTKVSGERFAKGSRPTVTLTVPRLKDGPDITGKVHVYVGKKRVRTIKIKATRHAEYTVKLPVRPKSSIKVRAVYSGTKNIKGSTSKTITLRPRG